MATLDQVINQIAEAGLPQLPHGHPVLDGKIKRFGPGKKAWYVLRELDLRSGRRVITGAFGMWHGTNQNAVPVTIEWEGVSTEERAEIERKQAAFEAKEAEKKLRQAEMAANRARQQIEAASDTAVSPYLTRKQVPAERVYVRDDGTTMIPMYKYSRAGAKLVGLQKIAQDGSKRYSSGMDKIGAGLLLGPIADSTALFGIAEGYATAGSVREAMDQQFPVMVAFDAGGLLAVAKQLRAAFPSAHILFLADDDAFMLARFHECLLKDFKVVAPVPVDGMDQQLVAEDGSTVRVKAAWRKDAAGIDYIEADIRAGRLMRIMKFENAGLSKAHAAARVVGNASVVWPKFADRAENRWSDFNDLHVEQALSAVTEQVLFAIEASKGVKEEGDSMPVWLDAPGCGDPAPLVTDDTAAEQGASPPDLDKLLAHYALVYGSTDVWDGLRKQKLKKSAFHAAVGKSLAAEWDSHPKRRQVMPETLPALIRGRAVGPGGGGKLTEMLDHITLLRGTETVWDGIGQQVMTLGAVRADYTAELTSKWQEHALRKTIEAKNLVFDPTQQADPETHVNIFLGWPLTPKANVDLVTPILALLESLCGAEDNVDDCVAWILRWLAYPLQHPGAKMQTALLMFGEKQGTGKSLFFQDVISPIYGEYGTVASQHQLDSSFTAWRSRKLFVLFEEVLSRDDKYSHNGTLKYMVTGKHMSINQKNLPERTETNHLNAAFLSNEPQPIPIELEDRRFMVIEARKKQDQAFYEAVHKSIKAGGIEAFYDFLLHFPLDDFNEHTKPMMTLAKERVIEFGLNGWMSFHRSWKDGYLTAPYCSCLTEDLFVMYKRWCDKTGEKPLTLCKFSGLIASRENKVKRSVTVGTKYKTTRMVYEIRAQGEIESLDDQIARFRKDCDIRADGTLQQ